jgi:hypothetical protein
MNETRILIRLLWMYIPRNWEFGSALSNVGISGGGGVETPFGTPLITIVVSVCPSIGMEKFGSYWKDFV